MDVAGRPNISRLTRCLKFLAEKGKGIKSLYSVTAGGKEKLNRVLVHLILLPDPSLEFDCI